MSQIKLFWDTTNIHTSTPKTIIFYNSNFCSMNACYAGSSDTT